VTGKANRATNEEKDNSSRVTGLTPSEAFDVQFGLKAEFIRLIAPAFRASNGAFVWG